MVGPIDLSPIVAVQRRSICALWAGELVAIGKREVRKKWGRPKPPLFFLFVFDVSCKHEFQPIYRPFIESPDVPLGDFLNWNSILSAVILAVLPVVDYGYDAIRELDDPLGIDFVLVADRWLTEDFHETPVRALELVLVEAAADEDVFVVVCFKRDF